MLTRFVDKTRHNFGLTQSSRAVFPRSRQTQSTATTIVVLQLHTAAMREMQIVSTAHRNVMTFVNSAG